MQKLLDRLFAGAEYAAGLCIVATLLSVLAGILGRLLHFNLPGTDAYAGYSMAAASFLALAATLRKGEHIRVTLFLQRLGGRAPELWCHAVAIVLSGALAWFSLRLVWQSYIFHDVSQGIDATPLWIPQIAMAAGAILLFLAFVGNAAVLLRGGSIAVAPGEGEPAHIE